jgi:hypothetical protein
MEPLFNMSGVRESGMERDTRDARRALA